MALDPRSGSLVPEPVAHTDSSTPKILVAAGPRAAEGAVFDWLDERLGRVGDGEDLDERLARLAKPVRIVVPSKSLRLHLSAELIRRRGRAAAGVVVRTLHGLAEEILQRAGSQGGSTEAEAEPDEGAALLHVLVRRLGRAVPALAEPLEELADGFAPVVATVRDFLDAGLEPELEDAVAEAAAQRSASGADPTGESGARIVGTRAERDRAEALVHLAAAVERALRAMELELPGHRLRRAADLLEADPDLLPSGGTLIHGFADATGAASALIETLLRRLGATAVIDRPPDPAAEPSADQGTAIETGFTRRFLDRLGALVETIQTVETIETVGHAETEPPPAALLRTLSAPGADAEARRVAGRIRALLDRGARPEGIAVVTRSLTPDQPFARAFRRHFARLGVPFSGVGGRGPLLPAGRRIKALLELLRRGPDVPTDRWLDAMGSEPLAPHGGAVHRLELRLALHALGAARLADVAGLDLDRFHRFEATGFPLPIREGFRAVGGEGGDSRGGTDAAAEEGGSEDVDPAERAARRRVPVAVLRRAVEDAGRLVRAFSSWPEPAPVAAHLARLRRLLTDDLGWPPVPRSKDDRAWPRWAPILALETTAPGRLELSYDELVSLLVHSLEAAGRDALGGAGGGVALLDAMEARGRTFEHLFLVGLNRGVFPRPIREDPLLADDLRRLLLDVLPDLPVKGRGFDEERHLFAQLVAAAPDVTLSWQSTTDDGQPNPRSPLVERMDRPNRADRADLAARSEPPAESHRPPAAEPSLHPLQPATEQVMAAGLAGDRPAFEQLLAIALREDRIDPDDEPARTAGAPGPPEAGARSWTDLAAAHRRILDEIDPDLSGSDGWQRVHGLGPYFGFIGATAPDDPGDPRRAELWVTTLERLAACPWQTFLGRLLRIEPTPDPLQAAPSLDALLIGSLVHAALEEVVTRALTGARAETLEEADAREPIEVPWPDAEELDAVLQRRAAALLADEGIALPGLERALAAAARPYLETARNVEWSPRAPSVLAAEVTGTVSLTDTAGAERSLHFRADRVDRMVDRRFPGLRLTDYKTGRPISDAVRQKTRDEHFLRQVEAGGRLQAVAYALATGGPLPSMHSGQGRYVFLKRDLPPEQREFGVWGSHVPFVDAFTAAVRAALRAWDQGTFFPRLVEPDRDQEPRRCAWCPVHEACVRGDSGARRRLADWATERRQGTLAPADAPGAGGDGATSALLGVWTLPSGSERAGNGGGA